MKAEAEAAARAAEAQAGRPPEWALRELGLDGSASPTPEQAKAAYRSRAKALHPDSGGDAAAFQRLGEAWKAVERHGA